MSGRGAPSSRRRRSWAWAWAALAAAGCSGPQDEGGGSPAATASGLLPRPDRAAVEGAELDLLAIPFAPTPEMGKRSIAALTEFVERRSGLRLRVLTFGTYAEVEQALVSGEGDAALLSPLLYVNVVDRFAREPGLRGVRLRPLVTAVAGGSPTYVGYVVAAADSALRDLADVQGRPFGMVEGSTSGYLYALDLADSRGMDPARLFDRVRFYNQHPPMLADLLRPAGERPIEAGALYQHIVDVLGPEVRAKLRILAKTARIPRDMIVACIPLAGGREDARALELAAALQHVLLEMDHDPQTAEALREGIGYDGWIVGDDRRFDAIRKVYQRFGHYRFGGGEARSE